MESKKRKISPTDAGEKGAEIQDKHAEFTQKTKDILARRVGFCCSIPIVGDPP